MIDKSAPQSYLYAGGNMLPAFCNVSASDEGTHVRTNLNQEEIRAYICQGRRPLQFVYNNIE